MSKLSYEIAVKSVAWFILAENVREAATPEEDAQLTESIKRYGILQSLGAMTDGLLVWGRRRLRCGVAAGLTEAPVVLLGKDMSEGEYLTLQMLENVQRADLTPYDLWQGCVRLLEANPGWKLADVSKALSMDQAVVTRVMSASKAAPPVVEALRAGRLGTKAVYAITRGETPQEQERLLALALGGASCEALGKEVRKARTPPAEGVKRIRLELASGVTVVFSAGSLSLDAAIEAASEAGREMKRGRDQGLTAKTISKITAEKNGK